MKKLSNEEKKIYNCISKMKKEKNDYFYDFGYNCFGPLLYGYCTWILNNLKDKKIEKVYFLSRDGYIMKKAFDIINYTNIKTYYLEVSRRSLRVPCLYLKNSFSDICNCLPDSKLISIIAFFETIGLDIENYNDELKKYGYNKLSVFENKHILNDKKLRDLYNSILIKDVKKNSKIEYDNLIEYLKYNDVKGKFAIVDIGWAGSMQRYLNETLDSLNIKHSIYGYYIGVADYYTKNMREGINANMYGYLFDYKNKVNQTDYRKPFVGLFESLFLEQNGSVKNYQRKKNKIIAVRDKYEYIVNGKETEEVAIVGCIQEGAINFISDNITNRQIIENATPYTLFYDLYRVGVKPTYYEAKIFGDFKFYDNGICTYLAKKNNKKSLKNDFLSSRWKIGFLKRLFVIKLPYEAIFNKLYKFK